MKKPRQKRRTLSRAALGALPDRVTGQASGNIIKNVKTVAVPEL